MEKLKHLSNWFPMLFQKDLNHIKLFEVFKIKDQLVRHYQLEQ